MNLTPKSAPHIISFISSPRCRLKTLRCNGNALGIRAVRAIIQVIRLNNFTLTDVPLYSNRAPEDARKGSDTDEDALPTLLKPWKESEYILARLMARNKRLSEMTRSEAPRLLIIARTLLLRHEYSSTPPSSSAADLGATSTQSPFLDLPTELQLHTFSFLTPHLSSVQLARIYTFASTSITLPPYQAQLAEDKDNSLKCTERREQWLREVGCCGYDRVSWRAGSRLALRSNGLLVC